MKKILLLLVLFIGHYAYGYTDEYRNMIVRTYVQSHEYIDKMHSRLATYEQTRGLYCESKYRFYHNDKYGIWQLTGEDGVAFYVSPEDFHLAISNSVPFPY